MHNLCFISADTAMKDYQAVIEPESTYHIYNRANGSEKLFLSDYNYSFFMQRYSQFIQPIAQTYCYCLMPNHFHFLIKIKTEKELCKALGENLIGFKNLSGLSDEKVQNLSDVISNQFSRLFNSYTKAFNKQRGRKGSLFSRPFKRRKIHSNIHLLKLVCYIHQNPVEAHLCAKPEHWKFSSYHAMISVKPTLLERNTIISLFDNKENFVLVHQSPTKDLTGF